MQSRAAKSATAALFSKSPVAGQASVGSEEPPLPWICSLSLWLAWKVTTRRASIGMASPVRGLRPGRGALVRIWKLPKPEILTSAPTTRRAAMRSKKASIMSFDSRLFSPICSNSSSASWALVNAGVSRLSTANSMVSSSLANLVVVRSATGSSPQASAELRSDALHHRPHGRLDLVVGQCRVGAGERQADGQAFLAIGHAARGLLRLVDVEQQRIAQQAAGFGAADGREQRGMRDLVADDHRQVALRRLELGHRLEGGHLASRDSIEVYLEEQRRVRQLPLLAPARVQ